MLSQSRFGFQVTMHTPLQHCDEASGLADISFKADSAVISVSAFAIELISKDCWTIWELEKLACEPLASLMYSYELNMTLLHYI